MRRLLAASRSELLSRRPVLLGGPFPRALAAFRLRSSWIFTISSAVMGLLLALCPCCCSILSQTTASLSTVPCSLHAHFHFH